MTNFLIYTRLESFDFPLREATRKVVWEYALIKAKEGKSVEIVLLANRNKFFIRNGIKISLVKRWDPSKIKFNGDIHFITGSVSIWLLIVGLRGRSSKQLTLTDGDMFGYRWRSFRKYIVRILPRLYDHISVFSEYQRKRLDIANVSIVKPWLPNLDLSTRTRLSMVPTMLYMGHLSFFKGVDTIIKAFRKVVKDYPDALLVIANNSVRGDVELIKEVNRLKSEFPNNLVIKGVIDPVEELTRCWVYLYPFKEAIGTMAFALSLYEAEACGTPYVACDVGANREFFDIDRLISVDDDNMLARIVSDIFDETAIKEEVRFKR